MIRDAEADRYQSLAPESQAAKAWRDEAGKGHWSGELSVMEKLWRSLVSVVVEQDGNASGKAGTAAGLKWVKSTEHASR